MEYIENFYFKCGMKNGEEKEGDIVETVNEDENVDERKVFV